MSLSNVTVEQLISELPSTYEGQDIINWFAKCYRFAEIGDYPEVKETAYLAIARIGNLTAVKQYKDTINAQLIAIRDISTVNTQEE